MLAMPEPPVGASSGLAASLAVPWWIALAASALTFGFVYAHRTLLVGLALGAGTSLAGVLLSGAPSAATTCAILGVALTGSLAGARFGAALRRIARLQTARLRR